MMKGAKAIKPINLPAIKSKVVNNWRQGSESERPGAWANTAVWGHAVLGPGRERRMIETQLGSGRANRHQQASGGPGSRAARQQHCVAQWVREGGNQQSG